MKSGMLIYSPEDYEMRQSSVTIATAQQRLLTYDSRRVYLGIQRTSLVLPVSPFLTFNGNGDEIYHALMIGGTLFELTWINNYTMTCSEVWANGFSIGDVFSMMEVLYNPYRKRSNENDTRKPETLAAKIKRFSEHKRGSGGIANDNVAKQPTSSLNYR